MLSVISASGGHAGRGGRPDFLLGCGNTPAPVALPLCSASPIPPATACSPHSPHYASAHPLQPVSIAVSAAGSWLPGRPHFLLRQLLRRCGAAFSQTPHYPFRCTSGVKLPGPYTVWTRLCPVWMVVSLSPPSHTVIWPARRSSIVCRSSEPAPASIPVCPPGGQRVVGYLPPPGRSCAVCAHSGPAGAGYRIHAGSVRCFRVRQAVSRQVRGIRG